MLSMSKLAKLDKQLVDRDCIVIDVADVKYADTALLRFSSTSARICAESLR